MNHSPNSVFGRRLREARRVAGLPQDKLGVLVGLDEGTASARMSRYEGGVHEPPYRLVVKLADVLRIPVAYFYCGDDELASLIVAWPRLLDGERDSIRAIVAAHAEEFSKP
ncbi:helix-turn-helix domain-containing protein [Burkholderia multivorans]|uniref:helix-turn-helix domain-containing protein n=1 Tax=Burkholderia multivorans TaxID=87883 RepID=UPI00159258B5|nr:helix-turn-helix transcriptional regulator [Burkholderia multivorans]MCA8336990.1 helix-turn-helix domain-containing protein [Burkholderia multivorans]